MYISVELAEGLGKQLFQFAALLRLQNDRVIVLQYNDNITQLYQDQFYVLPEYDYKQISFTQFIYDTDTNTGIEHVQHSKHNLMLKGSFQTFQNITENIRKKMIELVYSNEDLMYKAYDKYNEIKRYFGEHTTDNDMICVHIKRNTTSDKHILYLDYYKKALQMANKRYVVIFSDDIKWCKKNVAKNLFQYDNIYFADTNSPSVDFITISMFQHHIIANSTFSLWTSFISSYENDSQIIIAPKDWYPYHNNSTIYHKKITHII